MVEEVAKPLVLSTIPRSSQDTGVYVGFDEFELPEEA